MLFWQHERDLHNIGQKKTLLLITPNMRTAGGLVARVVVGSTPRAVTGTIEQNTVPTHCSASRGERVKRRGLM